MGWKKVKKIESDKSTAINSRKDGNKLWIFSHDYCNFSASGFNSFHWSSFFPTLWHSFQWLLFPLILLFIKRDKNGKSKFKHLKHTNNLLRFISRFFLMSKDYYKLTFAFCNEIYKIFSSKCCVHIIFYFGCVVCKEKMFSFNVFFCCKRTFVGSFVIFGQISGFSDLSHSYYDVPFWRY